MQVPCTKCGKLSNLGEGGPSCVICPACTAGPTEPQAVTVTQARLRPPESTAPDMPLAEVMGEALGPPAVDEDEPVVLAKPSRRKKDSKKKATKRW